MGKTLVIAEKPSVARDIARVLKCGEKGEGCLVSGDYVVSWAIGHLIGLSDPEDYDAAYKKWRLEALPIIPREIKLKVLNNTKSQFNILKKLMNDKEVKSIICATDSGREGELIFRYIYDAANCKKPFSRLWISSMTDAAIKEGFQNLKDGAHYDNLYRSAKCRSEADWLVGINASRAFTVKYGALLSVGRVQTPTLAIIVARQNEINAFVPQDYYEITAFFNAKDIDFSGKWFDPANNGETKILSKDRAEEIAQKAGANNGFGTVESSESEEKRKPPPLLYDLTELQRDANKKFGFTAQKTLETAQDLYEKRKMITYPRTDSRFLSGDMAAKLPGIVKKLAGVGDYAEYAGRFLADGALSKAFSNKRITDDSKVTDHHAIIPTGVIPADLNSLGADARKIYDLVARRFLAVFYPYYVYNVTKIVIDINGEKFLSKGSVVLIPGWTELYQNAGEPSEKGEDDNEALPGLKVSESAAVKEIITDKKRTKPPAPYTEASLLSAMENAGRFIDDEALKEQLKDSGLGTPATRAAIIERLIKVDYITRKGKALNPTEKGMKLIEVVPPELKSPETTGKWEKGLSSIAKGGMSPERFMQSIERYVNYLVDEAKKSGRATDFPTDKKPRGKGGAKTAGTSSALGTCPLCGGGIFENTKAFYCGNWKSGCRFTVWKSAAAAYGVTLSPEMVTRLLAGEIITGAFVTHPDTKEKRPADIALKPETPAKIAFLLK